MLASSTSSVASATAYSSSSYTHCIIVAELIYFIISCSGSPFLITIFLLFCFYYLILNCRILLLDRLLLVKPILILLVNITAAPDQCFQSSRVIYSSDTDRVTSIE